MKALGILLILTFVVWGGVRIIADIQFDRNCEGYLKRAADANTVELAKKQLEVALKYIEEEKLTSGYTSIIYRTPDEDVGFWYENIKNSLNELNTITADASKLERSNMLMKLRETLLDQGKEGVKITVPTGISVYPHNTVLAIFGVFSFIIAIVEVINLSD